MLIWLFCSKSVRGPLPPRSALCPPGTPLRYSLRSYLFLRGCLRLRWLRPLGGGCVREAKRCAAFLYLPMSVPRDFILPFLYFASSFRRPVAGLRSAFFRFPLLVVRRHGTPPLCASAVPVAPLSHRVQCASDSPSAAPLCGLRPVGHHSMPRPPPLKNKRCALSLRFGAILCPLLLRRERLIVLTVMRLVSVSSLRSSFLLFSHRLCVQSLPFRSVLGRPSTMVRPSVSLWLSVADPQSSLHFAD